MSILYFVNMYLNCLTDYFILIGVVVLLILCFLNGVDCSLIIKEFIKLTLIAWK